MSAISQSAGELFRLSDVSKMYPVARSTLGRLFDRRTTAAIRGLNLCIRKGDTLGIVGESGSGKTTVARLLVKLIEPTKGTVLYQDTDVGSLKGSGMRSFRDQVQMVFQSTHSSLNPRKTVATALSEARGDRNVPLTQILDRVRLPANVLRRLPHQLSGGQRQRVGIARAIARSPAVLIADEPTSSLDVSLQAEIIALLQELCADHAFSLVVISHDLALVAALCSTVAVMQAGRIVEQGLVEQVLHSPKSTYTQSLLAAIPRGFHD